MTTGENGETQLQYVLKENIIKEEPYNTSSNNNNNIINDDENTGLTTGPNSTNENGDDQQVAADKKTFSCDIDNCNKQFSSPYRLKVHGRSHTGMSQIQTQHPTLSSHLNLIPEFNLVQLLRFIIIRYHNIR